MLNRCTFVTTNGAVCRGLAVQDSTLCHIHYEAAQRDRIGLDALRQRRSDMSCYGIGNTSLGKVPGVDQVFDDASAGMFSALKLPQLEDAYAVQVTLTAVIHALSQQMIPTKNAGLILYGIQMAMANLDRVHLPFSNETVSLETPPKLPGHND